LGLHPGPDINLYAAASLAGLPEHDTSELLTQLTQAHLIKQHIPERYQLHDLLRAYATEQVTAEEAEPQQRAALHRVLDYYLHTSAAAHSRLSPQRDMITLHAPQPGTISRLMASHEQAIGWFTAEHVVLLAAIDYAVAHEFDAHAWQLPWTLTTFLNRRGHWNDYITTQQAALAAAQRLGDRTVQAYVYSELGRAQCRRANNYVDALGFFEQSFSLYQDLEDRNGLASVHLCFAWVYGRQGKWAEAFSHNQQALDLSNATGNQYFQARILNSIGYCHARLGQDQQGLAYCEKALYLHRVLGDRVGEAHTLDSLAYVHYNVGQHDQAITRYQQALTLYRELGYNYYVARVFMKLGDSHHAAGDDHITRQMWQQSLAIFEELGHPEADTIRAKLAVLDTDPDESTTDDQQL
jgi:tetratricopeptide (TPR) repeat protein